MSIAEKLQTIAENEQRVYNAALQKGKMIGAGIGYDNGYKVGKEEGFQDGVQQGYKTGKSEGIAEGIEQGKQAEYDKFWDNFQDYGNPKNYYYAFAYNCWNDNNYNPKYPINCNTDNTGGNNTFRSSIITDTKVPVIIPGNGTAAFYQSKLKTIRKLVVTENTSYSNMFYITNELENLTIEGIIAKEINLGSCKKLTHDSLMSVINHLGTITTALTLTLGDTNLAKLTDTEKAIATQKGWTLA